MVYAAEVARMGMLVDGQWQDVWDDTKATKGPLRAQRSAIPQLGYTRRQPPGLRAKAGFVPSRIGITYMSRSPAPGRIARSSIGSSRGSSL